MTHEPSQRGAYMPADYARVANEIRDRFVHNESASATKIIHQERAIVLDALDLLSTPDGWREFDPEGYTRQNMAELRRRIERMEVRESPEKIAEFALAVAHQIDDAVEIGGCTHAQRLARIQSIVGDALKLAFTGLAREGSGP